MQNKKRYTSDEKTIILREYLENHVPISDLAEKYKLHPNAIYKWKKLMFECTPENLSKSKKQIDKQHNQAEQQISELKELLSKRESLIAELVEDIISLKKNINGDILTRNGLSRRLETK